MWRGRLSKSLVKQRKVKTAKQHLMKLNKTVTLISKKFDEDERKKLEREKTMKEMFRNISLHRQEQYSRRNCLPIYGLSENRNENTDPMLLRL